MTTRVKICGLKEPVSALAACEAGADAIGLVFYAPSPRAVTVSQAQAIVELLPPFVTTVGLFVNPPECEVAAVLDQLPLDMLQFHGDERNSFCKQFRRPFLKALGVSPDFSIEAAEAAYPDASGLLLDTYDPVKHGGTGKVFDWNRFPEHSNKPLILAGGLTPANVREAIRQTKPYAVDVSGGVEKGRGQKSNDLIRAFVGEVIRDNATGF